MTYDLLAPGLRGFIYLTSGPGFELMKERGSDASGDGGSCQGWWYCRLKSHPPDEHDPTRLCALEGRGYTGRTLPTSSGMWVVWVLLDLSSRIPGLCRWHRVS